jgi:hypothetical protein
MSSDSATHHSSFPAQMDNSAAHAATASKLQGVKHSAQLSQGPCSQERSGVELPAQIPALATAHLHEREVLLTEEDSDL